jgi:putative flavoprotein involved in K+ transport
LEYADGERLTFADDLRLSLETADRFFDERFRAVIDAYIKRAAIDAPPDDREAIAHQPEGTTGLNLVREGISTIIWATGYALDYSWIEARILDPPGYPRNVRGTTDCPGLNLLGLLWQHSRGSASLVGPELDAPYLVERMTSAHRSSANRRSRRTTSSRPGVRS